MIKILIPIDFSETSINAIKYAMRLLKDSACEFIVLNAFADEVYSKTNELNSTDFEKFKKEYKKNVDSTLKQEIDELFKLSANLKHRYTAVSRFGSLIDETNRIIAKENIDLVIMGAMGKTNDRSIAFGRNTLQIIKHLKCPVLYVPINYQKDFPKKILFPSDYMMPYKKRELKLVSAFAVSFAASVNFLYVSGFKKLSHRQLDHKLFLDSCFTDNKCAFLQISGKDLIESINKTVDNHKMDMLVMVNQRHSYFENILYNSTIEEVALQIKVPFLVLQNLHR
ncbi:universal stress protein [Polaribacter sp. IC073]|uniref:universal stress protein n=1 Tax=Polaribacter sp. IC073 TaxID=2508540 RepID=UPI0011BDA8AE|nr:universal stress protein [Polaribacter sp. IC073]TXD48661.1 universal stress protein [Polaribacter sp. IC073]